MNEHNQKIIEQVQRQKAYIIYSQFVGDYPVSEQVDKDAFKDAMRKYAKEKTTDMEVVDQAVEWVHHLWEQEWADYESEYLTEEDGDE